MPKSGLYQKVREMVSGMPSRENDGLYQAMVDTAAAGMVTIDERGLIQACNPALCRIFGYDTEELLGQSIEVLMPDAYARQHQAHIDRYLEEGEAAVMGRGREVMALRKNGEEFPAHLSVSEMTFAGSRSFTGVVHDLSASVVHKRHGYSEQAWMANILDHTPLAVTVKDSDGRYLLMNRQAEQLFQIKADSAVGKQDMDLFNAFWANMERRIEQDVIQNRCSQINVQPIVLQQHVFTLLVSKTPLYDSAGRLLGVVSVLLDISALSAVNQGKTDSAELLNLLPQALAFVSEDGDILHANQAYAKRFGMNATAVQNCNLKVLESDQIVTEFQQLLSGEAPFVQITETGLAPLRLEKSQLEGQRVIVLSE